MAITIEDIQTAIQKEKVKANKMRKNDIPHLEADLKAAQNELHELEIGIKYLNDFLKLFKALQDRKLIAE